MPADPLARCNRLRQELIDLLRALPYADYLRSEHWREVSQDARLRGLRRCQLCGASGRLHVHHADYTRRGHERPEDVIVLCELCHQAFHELGHLPTPTVWGRM